MGYARLLYCCIGVNRDIYIYPDIGLYRVISDYIGFHRGKSGYIELHRDKSGYIGVYRVVISRLLHISLSMCTRYVYNVHEITISLSMYARYVYHV